jgi:hypothetical protein
MSFAIAQHGRQYDHNREPEQRDACEQNRELTIAAAQTTGLSRAELQSRACEVVRRLAVIFFAMRRDAQQQSSRSRRCPKVCASVRRRTVRRVASAAG